MMKKNCWEVMDCGLQPGGDTTHSQGICPASIPGECNGINYGVFGGRFCWAIVGTLCSREAVESSDKLLIKIFTDCIHCDFFKKVQDEESNNFVILPKDMHDP